MFAIDFYGPRFLSIACDRYRDNGRLAVFLLENGEPFATLSVNLPGEALAADEFAVKTYSENEGLYEALLAANAIEITGRTVSHLRLPVCRLISQAAGAISPS